MRGGRLLLFVAAVAAFAGAAPPGARADRRTSIKIFQRGKRLYQHHHYAAAIKAFKKAYDEHPAPAYLYNIAQAYRELGRCSDARFFYKQFSAQTHSAKYRAVARRKIRALASKCRARAGPGAGTAPAAQGGAGSASGGAVEPAAGKTAGGPGHGDATVGTGAAATGSLPAHGAPAQTTAPAAASGGGASAGGNAARTDGFASDAGSGAKRAGSGAKRAKSGGGGVRRGVGRSTLPRPSGLVALAEGGAAFHDIGTVVVPVTPLLRVGAGYGMPLGRIRVAALGAAELSPMTYQKMAGNGTALFANLLAEIHASVPLGRALRLGAGVGAGLLMISGLEDGNPFTAGGAAATITSFTARLGLTAEYRLASRLAIAVSPALSYSPGGNALAADIGAITRFEVLAGVRYRP